MMPPAVELQVKRRRLMIFPWVAMMLEGLVMMLEFVPLMYQPLLVAGEVMKNKVPAKFKKHGNQKTRCNWKRRW